MVTVRIRIRISCDPCDPCDLRLRLVLELGQSWGKVGARARARVRTGVRARIRVWVSFKVMTWVITMIPIK